MSFDYKELCEKMGYDPLKDKFPRDTSGKIEDDRPSPYAKLTPEELDFVEEYYLKHKNVRCD